MLTLTKYKKKKKLWEKKGLWIWKFYYYMMFFFNTIENLQDNISLYVTSFHFFIIKINYLIMCILYIFIINYDIAK